MQGVSLSQRTLYFRHKCTILYSNSIHPHLHSEYVVRGLYGKGYRSKPIYYLFSVYIHNYESLVHSEALAVI